MTAGYYRFPTIHEDTVVFVSEDDLWTVVRQGGVARRLTSNLGEVNYPALSPDGRWLAFVGREEGLPEVYLMPAEGGSARRMTYLNQSCQVLGWTRDSQAVLFSSTYGRFHPSDYSIYRIEIESRNGEVTQMPVGPARSIALGPHGQVVIGRNTGDPARWKRYRGGTAGHLWIDNKGDGNFVRFLPELQGNIASPMWLELPQGPRVFFVSDHEGIGNLYSVGPDGSDLRRHTDHADFYTRNPSSDGRRIVYHAGADLCVYDPITENVERVEIDYRSPRVQRNRKFVPAVAYLDSASLNPTGDALTVTTRGKAFAFYNHEGPVLQLGQRDGVRYRLPNFLNDDAYVVTVDDVNGEEELVIHSIDPDEAPRRLLGLDIGRPLAMKVSPTADQVALTNHRQELLVVDLASGELTVVDRSEWRPIAGFDWSPDGRWLAYGFANALNITEIRLYRLTDAETGDAGGLATDDAMAQRPPNPVAITRPVLHDVAPAFDPDGKYLYFLSYREFNPVYDNLHFDLGFPWGMRPYLITLRADLPNPFIPRPEFDESPAGEEDEEVSGDEEPSYTGEGDDFGNGEEDGYVEDDEDASDLDVDEEGEDYGDEEYDGSLRGGAGCADDHSERPLHRSRRGLRLLWNNNRTRTRDTAPLPEAALPGIATESREKKQDEKKSDERKSASKLRPIRIDLQGIERRVIAFPVSDSRYGQIAGAPGRALFTSLPIRGALDGDHAADDDDEDTGALRAWIFKEYKSETIAEDVSAFEVSRNYKKLMYFSGRRLRVISATEKAPSDSGPGRRSGWIDLSRIKVSVLPQREWEQMYREAWRLQRDHYWTEDMSEVDWHAVYERYFPLIERVSTRSEFSDLVWEMQGELGTSHAYEMGGDYRRSPAYTQGVLGAEMRWDSAAGGYRISSIIEGDPWIAEGTSALAVPGVDVQVGDLLVAINGQRLDAETGPAQLLVNQAGCEVLLSLAPRPAADESQAAAAPAEDAVDKSESRRATHAVVVRALHNDVGARYRAWVESNRRYVHTASDGRVGYLHIPDMGPRGYAEFHRGYLAEVNREGLIVDVRYNGGGHVSQLLLEKLARRRIGYDKSRWGGLAPYPTESISGPIVALTNELAGSDGDVFCHSFKLLKLGLLVGKRTWGGVVGYAPPQPLVDGTVTTQPEFSFWFEDVGWKVENYGTEPDIDVDNTPQDYVAGSDAQLERAVAETLRLLAGRPVLKPDLAQRPSRALPKLPPK